MLEQNEISKMNIYELRKYAKRYGVKSPTSKTRPQLLEQMEKIREGQVTPQYSNAGRPVIENRQSFIDMMELLKEFKTIVHDFQGEDSNTLYNFYQEKMSSFTDIDLVLNIYDFKDFMIYFDELIRNSFEADVFQIKNNLYKLIFKEQTVIVSVEEKLP